MALVGEAIFLGYTIPLKKEESGTIFDAWGFTKINAERIKHLSHVTLGMKWINPTIVWYKETIGGDCIVIKAEYLLPVPSAQG